MDFASRDLRASDEIVIRDVRKSVEGVLALSPRVLDGGFPPAVAVWDAAVVKSSTDAIPLSSSADGEEPKATTQKASVGKFPKHLFAREVHPMA